ncbi:cell wall glycosyl hydrolase [Grosmannia clavigera kw1407]|uniref:Mannan endo-1,6-alpha-mannosidase n=1 Tax=Grosmannia clavigera (strain kw1407 / UAMH 11150) TaxID=655863 RepID=F0XAF4_GROCL|nr:cell wall glycosyl hydrolase [Grosmannia clavigera kw1407]EFX05539.1 cell wall glycosyl hydrolase [Grosmannia clavigera kw1407]
MLSTLLFAGVAAASLTVPDTLDVSDTTSILDVSKTLASGVMSYYNGTAETFQDLPTPYYWWESGAMFGAMLDYSHYTNDSTYDDMIATALMAQVGPNYDFMLPKHYGDEGNDDQAFWGFAVLAAAERNFPQPAGLTPAGMPSWLDLGVNIWSSMVARWNTTQCGGGFNWQIFASNSNGLHYRNSVSNGGVFHLSARLAALTGNQTYVDWAARIWDWSTAIGLVDEYYNVWDGVDANDNCSKVNMLSFSYAAGIYLQGAAAMANLTGSLTAGTSEADHQLWSSRTAGLMAATQASFFNGGPSGNVTDVLWEHACEGVNTCDTDMKSFKGYLSRFMSASAALVPVLAPAVRTYLRASAAAAAKACSGTGDGVPTPAGATCGQKWYVGGFDGSVGLGQQMSALETVQALLALPEAQDTAVKVASRAISASSPVTSPMKPALAVRVAMTSAGAREMGVRWLGLGLVFSVSAWLLV